MQSPSKTSPSKTSPSKTSPSKNNDENERATSISDAHELLTDGKRHLLLSNIHLAVDNLAESCEILSKVFGETAEECAEAYYYYGKALLEMSRMENRVLGNALEGVDIETNEDDSSESSAVEDPEKMTKDEKLEVQGKVAEALEENFENHDRIARTHTGEDEEEDEDEDDDQDDKADEDGKGDENKEAEKADETSGKPEDKPEDAEDEEEPSNLQLAWEMLELAKVIYGRTVDSATGDKKVAAEAKVCESFLCLGEVSLENENYSQAVADFTECLNKRKANLPADSRSIAETHYQLGVAQAFDGKYEDAEHCLRNAIAVLETRIANLGKMETSQYLAKEISDLEDLVTEIKEKIEDHKNMEKAKAEGKETGFSGSDDKPVSNIGIKKKSVDLGDAKASGTATVGSA